MDFLATKQLPGCPLPGTTHTANIQQISCNGNTLPEIRRYAQKTIILSSLFHGTLRISQRRTSVGKPRALSLIKMRRKPGEHMTVVVIKPQTLFRRKHIGIYGSLVYGTQRKWLELQELTKFCLTVLRFTRRTFSVRTPKRPGKYNPGSSVTVMPALNEAGRHSILI